MQAPLPWPPDAKAHPLIQDSNARDVTSRVQLITGAGATGIEIARYRAEPGPFGGYTSDELDGSVLLVCCHGRRDVCCGGAGTRVASDLECRESKPFRTVRTSHLGGHRFAPTALVLPEGTMWAHANADLLTGIVTRSLPVERAMPHYRGCTGFGSPEAQVADAGALLLNGWEWLDAPRESTIVNRTESTTLVHVNGTTASYRALVGVRRIVPSPTCGDEQVTESTPTQTEYELLAIRPE